MVLALAIVGRPNVGKSTLFNRIAGRKLALVHDTPGVTRDRRDVEVTFGSLALRLIDTAGFEVGDDGSLAQRMTAQTLAAIADADVCLFLIDARAGVTAGDEIIAETLRRSGKPVILATNKCEGRVAETAVAEAYSLGFGEALAVSAEHALGMDQIEDALAPFADEPATEDVESDPADRPLRLAIVGRPNVGKSSLFNAILGRGAIADRPRGRPDARLPSPHPGPRTAERSSCTTPLACAKARGPRATHSRKCPSKARSMRSSSQIA